MRKTVHAIIGLAANMMTAATQAGTFEDVRARGMLACIVADAIPGFATVDEAGNWKGFDIDFCRATATAVLGDVDKVRYVTTDFVDRFTTLGSGKGDLLYRATSNMVNRDTGDRLVFPGTNYHDRQGFMVARDLGIGSALELDGARICVLAGSANEEPLAEYFRSNNMEYEAVPRDTTEQTRASLETGYCEVMTAGISTLIASRTDMEYPWAYTSVPDFAQPETISEMSFGPVVRQGDDAWAEIVRLVLNAIIAAEELGVTSTNVDSFDAGTEDPRIRRLLGIESNQGTGFGLDVEWARRVIRQVGNYGEIFDRHLGPGTPVKLERGLNVRRADGGLLSAPLFN